MLACVSVQEISLSGVANTIAGMAKIDQVGVPLVVPDPF